MPLVDQPFADTFVFSRGDRGSYRDAGGVERLARIDVPRFDHDPDGAPLGLLVEGHPLRWSPDRLSVQDGDWAVTRGTVLHEFATPAGVIERRAWYAPLDPVAAVDACLSIAAHHREIAYLPALLRNRGGYVRWGRRDWSLGGLILAEANVALVETAALILLEG